MHKPNKNIYIPYIIAETFSLNLICMKNNLDIKQVLNATLKCNAMHS